MQSLAYGPCCRYQTMPWAGEQRLHGDGNVGGHSQVVREAVDDYDGHEPRHPLQVRLRGSKAVEDLHHNSFMCFCYTAHMCMLQSVKQTNYICRPARRVMRYCVHGLSIYMSAPACSHASSANAVIGVQVFRAQLIVGPCYQTRTSWSSICRNIHDMQMQAHISPTTRSMP
jgi:hypothetical protein